MAFGSPVSSVVIANTDPLNVSVGNIVPVTGPNGGAVSIAGNVGVTGNVGLVAGASVNVGNTVPVSGSVALDAGASVNVGNAVALAAGTSVNVGNAVALAANTSVNVGNTVPVTGPAGAAVSVSGNVGVTGNVGLVAGTNVNVGNTVPVTGPAGAAVSVSGNVNIGNAVSIVDGASVNVGNAVSLAPNSAINVVNAVNLAAGAQVNVGNQVTVNGAVGLTTGTSVGVDKLPTEPAFWRCVSGDPNPPTLQGNAKYLTIAGQPCVAIEGSSSTDNKVIWGAVSRYGNNGEKSMLVSFLWWHPGFTNTGNAIQMGYPGALTISPAQESNTTLRLRIMKASGGLEKVASIAFPDATQRWHKIKIMIGPTRSMLSLNDGAWVRVLDAGIDVVLTDADIRATQDVNETFQFRTNTSGSPGAPFHVANLRIDHLETEPTP